MTGLLSIAAGGAAEAYIIDQSVRFDDGDSSSLTKTFASEGDRKTWTFSAWIKLGNIGADRSIFTAGSDSTNMSQLLIRDEDDLYFFSQTSSIQTQLLVSQVFRDPSAWYHIVFKYDSTPATPGSSDIAFYVNGSQVTAFDIETYPSQDTETYINDNVAHYISRRNYDDAKHWDGYIAEVYFIDGQALDASSFAETNVLTNQWVSKDASTLTFGTNGFYQKYALTELATSITDSANRVPKTLTANGNANTDTSIKKIGTASAQFDGSGDWLSIDSSSDFRLGGQSDSWTIEFWIYYNVWSGYFSAMAHNATVMANGGFSFYTNIAQGGGLGFDASNGTSWAALQLKDPDVPSVDTWYHYAIVQLGNSRVVMYRNGVEIDSDNDTMSDTSGSYLDWFIGGGYNEGGSRATWLDLDGYMDEVRISNVARYFGNFTPTTTAFTSDTNTLLLLHMDGSDGGTTFTDSADSPPRHTITNVDIVNTTAQKKVGDSSMYFSGATSGFADGDYLQLAASSDWAFGTGEWTLEGWFYNIATTRGSSLCWSQRNSSGLSPLHDTMQDHGTVASGVTTYKWQYSEAGTNRNVIHQTTVAINTWFHVACVRSVDTVTVYLNGVASDTTYDATGQDMGLNRVAVIGAQDSVRSACFQGYVDEIRISNTARYTTGFTPSTTAFTTDSNTLLLIHSNWNGGFGADSSGNENTFAATNLVAGDQMLDTPTNNFCVLNPLTHFGGGTFSEGNLQISGGNNTMSTFAPTSGKWYWEVYIDAVSSSGNHLGVMSTDYAKDSDHYNEFDVIGCRSDNYDMTAVGRGQGITAVGANSATLAGFTDGDIISFELNLDTPQVIINKNDSPIMNRTFTYDSTYPVLPWIRNNTSNISILNFGSDSSFAGNLTSQGYQDENDIGDFYYTPPAGYLALSTSNLPDPSIKKPGSHFNAVLYTGDGATTQAVTGVGFAPDFTWIKNRSAADKHVMVDEVRGATKYISSDSSAIEVDDSTFVASLDSDGFTVGDDVVVNTNTENYVSWNWLANGSGSANTDGTGLTSVTVSANTTAGFSICKYTGTGTAGDSFGHGLSVAPTLVIIKRLDIAAGWPVFNSTIGNTEFLELDTAVAKAAADAPWNHWNDTSPSASVVTLGDSGDVNDDADDYIAYCFHSVEGYSKVGSYTGNANADGSFIYTGFRPAYILLKSTNVAGSWRILNYKTPAYNVINEGLFTDTADGTYTSVAADFVSNGIKIRSSEGGINVAGPLIFIAFAETPFKTANAR